MPFPPLLLNTVILASDGSLSEITTWVKVLLENTRLWNHDSSVLLQSSSAALQESTRLVSPFPFTASNGASLTKLHVFLPLSILDLKKQGVLALTFSDPADYDKVQPTDFIDLVGIEQMAPGSTITMVCRHKDGSEEKIPLSHSFNEGQSGLNHHIFRRFLLVTNFPSLLQSNGSRLAVLST